jgi:Na+/melibiose symporter-like transporter
MDTEFHSQHRRWLTSIPGTLAVVGAFAILIGQFSALALLGTGTLFWPAIITAAGIGCSFASIACTFLIREPSDREAKSDTPRRRST